MEVCKICLEVDEIEDEDKEPPNLNEIQSIQKLIPQLNTFVNTNLMMCLICIKNIKDINKFIDKIKNTEQKIETLPKHLLKKVDIKSLHPQVNALPSKLKNHVAVCRLCLKFIPKPSIFLDESRQTNLLAHDLIKSMLHFCNINLNFSISHNPTMCTDCWEHLQISFSFKKKFLEVEQKIFRYCEMFNIQHEEIDGDILRKMREHFANNACDPTTPIRKTRQSSKTEMAEESCPPTDHDYINPFSESKNFVKNESYIDSANKRRIHVYSDEEDRIIITTYLFITENEKVFFKGYWNKISEIWYELCPHKQYPKYAIRNRFVLLKTNRMYKDLFKQIKSEVAKKLENDSSDEEDESTEILDELKSFAACNKNENVTLKSNAVDKIASTDSAPVNQKSLKVKLPLKATNLQATTKVNHPILPLYNSGDQTESVDLKSNTTNKSSCSDSSPLPVKQLKRPETKIPLNATNLQNITKVNRPILQVYNKGENQTESVDLKSNTTNKSSYIDSSPLPVKQLKLPLNSTSLPHTTKVNPPKLSFCSNKEDNSIFNISKTDKLPVPENRNLPQIRVKSFAVEKRESMIKERPKTLRNGQIYPTAMETSSSNGLQSQRMNQVVTEPKTDVKHSIIHSDIKLGSWKLKSPILQAKSTIITEPKKNAPLLEPVLDKTKGSETGRMVYKKTIPMETYCLTPMLTLEKADLRTSVPKTGSFNQFVTEQAGKKIKTNTIALPNNNCDIKNKSSVQTLAEVPVIPAVLEDSNDSDDPFIDEVCPSSLVNDIKIESVGDSDIEICIDEPKLELYSSDSDSDISLPELERMDIPSTNIQIGEVFTVDEKRDVINTVMKQDETTQDPNVNVESVHTCRRFMFKNQPVSNALFKCLECSFETKFRGSAASHAKCHKNRWKNKLYACPECPYKISNKWHLKKHMQLHKEENEIPPELLPWS